MNFLVGTPDTSAASYGYAATSDAYHAFDEDDTVHWACSFNIHGINNSDTTVILYKNGVVIAASENLTWTPYNVRSFWLGAYAVTLWWQNVRELAWGPANGVYDNLKIWSYAKTDFSDRDVE